MFPFNFSFFSSSAAAPTTVTVDFLVIAGGGAGGADNGSGWGGGAGAGGYRNSFNNENSGGGGSSETALELVTSTNVTVTVGAGGSGSLPNSTSGSNSVFSTITSIGGGHGGEPVNGPAANGGSGGGCATNGGGDNGRGLGTANQGFDGSGNDGGWSGGGGGAGQAGGVIPAANQAQLVLAGGNGLTSSINGTSITRAGGGGGAQDGFAGPGGTGGGGNGGTPPTAGTTNTGSGGGGRRTGGDGGDGGSGIVILRYPSSNIITVGAGLTFTTDTSISGVNITTFTAGTGDISIAAATPLAKVNNVYSMAFDAINDFINLGDFTSVLGSTNKFSTSLWCNWQGGTISRNGMLNFAPTFAGGTDTKFDVRFESASSIKITIDNGPTRTFSITPSIGSDWMHIAFTYDGTLSSGSADFDGVKLYINGVDTTGTTAVSSLPATIDFATMFGFLGFAQNFNEARKWNGSIDEVGIFNATLTQAQVTSIYNATTTGKTADLSDLTTPPIKWYRMGD